MSSEYIDGERKANQKILDKKIKERDAIISKLEAKGIYDYSRNSELIGLQKDINDLFFKITGIPA